MIRFFRRFAICVIAFLCAVFLCVHFVILEGSPRAAEMAVPSPEDVKTTKDFYSNLKNEAQSDDPKFVQLSISETEMNSLITLGARLTPEFRGAIDVQDDTVEGAISLPLPWLNGSRWLNASGTVPQYEGQFRAEQVQIGKLQLPWKMANWLFRTGGNLAVGNNFGDSVFDTPKGLTIIDDRMRFDFYMEPVGENNMIRDFFASLRGNSLPNGEEIVSYQARFNAALDAGLLPNDGSYLPFITFSLDHLIDTSTDSSLAHDYTAAMIALAKICGATDFSMVVGGIAFDDAPGTAKSNCDALTLNGRTDTRMHFTTAAALQAASNRGVSVAIGEFKELNDTIEAGGFDFTDIAANNAGIRLSDVVMSGTVDDLMALRERITMEKDLILSFEDIPGIMSGQAFEARYENVESDAYEDMLNMIETKIDALPIYQ